MYRSSTTLFFISIILVKCTNYEKEIQVSCNMEVDIKGQGFAKA